MDRSVDWGIHNARDLGGLGGVKPGRVYRMPRPDALDETGWAALESAGVRTLVDLRNHDEVTALALRPVTIRSVSRPIEDQDDESFMAELGEFLGSPTYYAENLRRWPDKIVAAIAAVADAPDGGVVVHCSAGRDRTGLIVALLLALVGVSRQETLDDYEISVRETNAHLLQLDHPHERPRTVDELEAGIRSSRRTLDSLLQSLDVENYLTTNGLAESQIRALRQRLLE